MHAHDEATRDIIEAVRLLSSCRQHAGDPRAAKLIAPWWCRAGRTVSVGPVAELRSRRVLQALRARVPSSLKPAQAATITPRRRRAYGWLPGAARWRWKAG